MSIVIGSMILCVIGTFILMWICSMLMGDDGLYVACFLFVALMFALLVKIHKTGRNSGESGGNLEKAKRNRTQRRE